MTRLLPLVVLLCAAPASAQYLGDPDLAPSAPGISAFHMTPATPSFGPRGTGVDFATTGPDNYTVADFYSVENNSGVAVASVSWDISAVGSAFFDLDGGANFGLALEPVIGFTSGMAVADVTWTLSVPVGGNVQHPAVITADFSPPMAPGASFSFGADTDFFVADPCPGGSFGLGPCVVTVTDTAGIVSTCTFVQISSDLSEVTCGPSGPTLTSSGCPGVGAVRGLGFTPGANVAVGWSTTLGSFVLPGGACAGTTIGIVAPTLAGIFVADGAGAFSIPVSLGAGVCGNVHVQGGELPSCTLSNVLTL